MNNNILKIISCNKRDDGSYEALVLMNHSCLIKKGDIIISNKNTEWKVLGRGFFRPERGYEDMELYYLQSLDPYEELNRGEIFTSSFQ